MGYDANFILRHVMKTPEFSLWGIRVIMKSSNRLQKLVFHAKLGDKVRNIHIGDSFHFLSLSLERLVESIRKDDIDMNIENFERFFVIFRRKYPWVKDEDINHILRKNIFPYKFFTDSSKLDVTIDEFRKIFEPKEENLKFFGERVTVEELEKGFEDTQNVIEIFRCTNARDYHDLYLCCDVMQLADIFYGGKPDNEKIAWMNEDDLRSSGQYLNIFRNGLRDLQKHGWTIHYNDYPYQIEGDHTAVCGIYTAAFLRNGKNPDVFREETERLWKKGINPAVYYYEKYFS